MVNSIIYNIKLLNLLIKDLLDYSNQHLTHKDLRISEFQISKLIAETISLYAE